jgi:hypothetical protein
MAFAFVQDFPSGADETSTSNYNAIHSAIMAKATDPARLIIHTAGFADDGFRIFEVWESREQCEKFMTEVVMPTVMEITRGNPGAPPATTTYELHTCFCPRTYARRRGITKASGRTTRRGASVRHSAGAAPISGTIASAFARSETARVLWRPNASSDQAGVSRRPNGQQAVGGVDAEASTAPTPEICCSAASSDGRLRQTRT